MKKVLLLLLLGLVQPCEGGPGEGDTIENDNLVFSPSANPLPVPFPDGQVTIYGEKFYISISFIYS
jgi:hypothetical protein